MRFRPRPRPRPSAAPTLAPEPRILLSKPRRPPALLRSGGFLLTLLRGNRTDRAPPRRGLRRVGTAHRGKRIESGIPPQTLANAGRKRDSTKGDRSPRWAVPTLQSSGWPGATSGGRRAGTFDIDPAFWRQCLFSLVLESLVSGLVSGGGEVGQSPGRATRKPPAIDWSGGFAFHLPGAFGLRVGHSRTQGPGKPQCWGDGTVAGTITVRQTATWWATGRTWLVITVTGT